MTIQNIDYGCYKCIFSLEILIYLFNQQKFIDLVNPFLDHFEHIGRTETLSQSQMLDAS